MRGGSALAPAVALGAVLLGSLGFSSMDRPRRSVHDELTRDAWALLLELGDPAADRDRDRCVEGIEDLVESVDGTEFAVLLDRFTHGGGPLRLLTAPPEMVSTDLYDARNHFDRAQRDRGSVSAFVDGVAFLGEQWVAATDRDRSARDSVIALARAIHALQDFHAHSNFAELAIAAGPARLGVERGVWPGVTEALRLAGLEPNAEGGDWYRQEAPSTLQSGLDRIGECLAPWIPGEPCGPAAAADPRLDGVLVLTWYPGGEPPGGEIPPHQRGEPTWCGTSDGYPCYTRSFSRREESDAPARACSTRYGSGVARIPYEGDYTHECFAKDEAAFGVVPVGEVARRKAQAYVVARAYASVRTALLLRATRAAVGEARWVDMLHAAEDARR